MSKRVSELWNHFSDPIGNNKVKCLHCSQSISISRGSTGNLIRHMKTKHHPIPIKKTEVPANLANFANNEAGPSNIESTDRENFAQPSSGNTNRSPDQDEPEQQSSSTSIKPTTFSKMNQSSMAGYFAPKVLPIKKSKEIDRQLITMIVKEYHPLSLVEDAEFRKFVNLLCPGYKIPTRKTLSLSFIPSFYNSTKDDVRKRIERASAACLTVDGWTSQNNDSYYAVTAHYIVDNEPPARLSSDLLGCISFKERHTAQNICNMLQQLLQEWGIENKIVAIVSDNAANMVAAVRLGGWRHWGCFAHSINLIVQDGLKEISIVLQKIKSTVEFFNRSSHAAAQLKSSQEQLGLPVLKLKNDVLTRWNSTLDMIVRVLKTKNAIISTMAIVKSTAANSADGNSDILTAEEWLVAEQATEVLQIFEAVTTAVSTQKKVSSSTVILFYKRMYRHMQQFDSRTDLRPETTKFVDRLKKDLTQRFGNIEDNELITQSTILDPRFKKFGFYNQAKFDQARTKLYNKIAAATRNPPAVPELPKDNTNSISSERDQVSSLIWDDFDKEVQATQVPTNTTASAIVEVDKYLEEPLVPRTEDPLRWWWERRVVYPRLYELVKRRLCILATSVPCERIFSKAGQTASERRRRLTTSKLSQLIFLSYNLGNLD